MSICTNCALLVWLYDQEGKWKIEPGLAAILVMEHILLLLKFGFSRLVPEVKLTPPLLTFFGSFSMKKVKELNFWHSQIILGLQILYHTLPKTKRC